jgi:hydrogenase maturation protease
MSEGACVVALGQPLAGDDGVGWRVLERLASQAPAGVELIFARDASALVDHARSANLLIVIDALLAPPAGRVRTLRLDDLASVQTMSSHGLGVHEAVSLGRALSTNSPDVWVVAITIERPTRLSGALSPRVAAAVDLATDTILALLFRAGHHSVTRSAR